MPRRKPPTKSQSLPVCDAERVDARFAGRVIAWQRLHGRHGLPWQHDTTPYRVWLSEVMLQQTQVATVLPYFEKFSQRFADVVALADAPQTEVMELWSGLGYYSRARNLHRCAQQVRDSHGGQFPDSFEALQDLPGIGRSTAAAIAVFAFGQRQAILDGNVKRVFCRYFGVEGVLTASPTINELWLLAQGHLPEHDLIPYTQGLMDLGATCCTRTRPLCDSCPVRRGCTARSSDRVSELPVRAHRKPVKRRRTTMLVLASGRPGARRIWLERRPDQGVWGGLLSLPESELPVDHAVEAHLGTITGLLAREPDQLKARVLEPVDHAFTHFKLLIEPLFIEFGAAELLAPERDGQWLSLKKVKDAALPAPVKKLLLTLE